MKHALRMIVSTLVFSIWAGICLAQETVDIKFKPGTSSTDGTIKGDEYIVPQSRHSTTCH